MVPKGRAGAFEGPAPANGVVWREALVPGALAAGVAAAAPEAMMDVGSQLGLCQLGSYHQWVQQQQQLGPGKPVLSC
jgi:hypothetical protein